MVTISLAYLAVGLLAVLGILFFIASIFGDRQDWNGGARGVGLLISAILISLAYLAASRMGL